MVALDSQIIVQTVHNLVVLSILQGLRQLQYGVQRGDHHTRKSWAVDQRRYMDPLDCGLSSHSREGL